MGRLEGRLRRLERQVRGRHDTPWQARVAWMSYEEVQAEIVRMAAQQGFVGSAADADIGPALHWLHEQDLASVDSLTEDDQAEWRAELGALASSVSGPW